MKKFLFLPLFLITFSIHSQSGKSIPAANIKRMDGTMVNSSSITNDGKPIILCVWEVTCKPSLTLLDNISENLESLQKKTGVKVVAISVDDSRNSTKVKPMIDSKAWEFEFYMDQSQDFKRAMNLVQCPFYCLIDKNGKIVWQKNSYMAGDEEVLFDQLYLLK